MKYTKRKDGLYSAYITVGKTAEGKPKRKYVYGKTKQELENKFLELKILYNKGTVIENDSMTIKQLGELWFKQTQYNNEQSTKKRNRGILENYIYPNLGHIYVKNLKTHHVQSMIIDMLADKKDTVRKTLQVIKSILNIAVNNDFVAKNVAQSIKIPTFKSKEKTPLSLEEQLKIENSTNKYKDLFVFLLYTGLRKGEVAGLTWDDIDFEKNTIRVNKAISFDTNKGSLKGTKTDNDRIIPILDKTRPILESRANNKESKYVFYKQDKGQLSDIAIKRMLESFKKETDVEFSLHQLRHTFCTMLYYSGISTKKAQQLMGHKSLKVTLEIYTHLDEEQEGNSTQFLNDYLSKRV